MERVVMVFLVAAVMVAGCRAAQEEPFELLPEEGGYEVVSVIDADTLKLDNSEVVRLIGVNAPEQNEQDYEESAYFVAQLIAGKKVVLESEGENRDRYGRLLRHIFVGGSNVAVLLLREGHAEVHEGYSGRYAEAFAAAQQKPAG